MEFDFDRESKKPLIKKIVKEIIILGVEIALVIGLAYGIIQFAVEKSAMIGSSMEVTLSDGDDVIINKFSYYFHDPQRYDVVVFKQSGKEHSYYNIKRIIGLPGETVQIKDGQVYINNERLDEPVNVDVMEIGGLAEEPIALEENEYFVLGDNCNNSEDSRFANIGNIVSQDIIGKVWVKLEPFNFVNKINMKQDNMNEE